MGPRQAVTRIAAAVRRAGGSGAVLGVLGLVACEGGSDPVGTGELLSTFERAVVEDVALDRIMDLLWVADGSQGGALPRLAFAFALPGVDAGLLGSLTTDTSFEPGLFEPSCGPSTLEGILDCLRLRHLENGDWEVQAYYTIPPDQTPRMQPDISYAGEGGVATVRFAPQPYRAWRFRTEGQDVLTVSADVDDRFTVTSAGGTALDAVVAGTLEAELTEPQVVRVELSVSGLPACPELVVELQGVEHGDSGGEIRCGPEVRADVELVRGEPVRVVWRD